MTDRRALYSSLAVALLTALPPVILAASKGIETAFQFFSADTFYYLTVAKNSDTGFYTYDGQNVTTGFHPLWQYVLTAIFDLLPDSSALEVWVTFLISSVLVGAGYFLVSLALIRISGHFLAPLVLVPGGFYLCVMLFIPHHGSPWSFINGMESPLSLLLFGVLLHHLSKNSDSWRSHAMTGGLLASISLCRLDDVFMPACLALVVVLRKPFEARSWMRAAIFGGPAALAIGAYLAANYLTTGIAMPVSGVVKLGSNTLMPNLQFFVNKVLLDDSGRHTWAGDLFRYLQMILPAFVSVLYVVYSVLRRSVRERFFGSELYLGGLCLYVVAKAFYNMDHLKFHHQGFWYYPVSILISNILLVLVLVGLITGARRLGRGVFQSIALLAVGMPALVLGMVVFFKSKDSVYNLKYYLFWRDRAVIRQAISSVVRDPKVIEVEDGLIGYSLGFPSMTGLGFALHAEALGPFREGRLLSYAKDHGYNLIASVNYGNRNRGRMLSPVKDDDSFELEEIYSHRESGARFVRFLPRIDRPGAR